MKTFGVLRNFPLNQVFFDFFAGMIILGLLLGCFSYEKPFWTISESSESAQILDCPAQYQRLSENVDQAAYIDPLTPDTEDVDTINGSHFYAQYSWAPIVLNVTVPRPGTPGWIVFKTDASTDLKKLKLNYAADYIFTCGHYALFKVRP